MQLFSGEVILLHIIFFGIRSKWYIYSLENRKHL